MDGNVLAIRGVSKTNKSIPKFFGRNDTFAVDVLIDFVLGLEDQTITINDQTNGVIL